MRRRITIALPGMMLLNADGFEWNTSIEYGQQGIGSDVTGNGVA